MSLIDWYKSKKELRRIILSLKEVIMYKDIVIERLRIQNKILRYKDKDKSNMSKE